MKTLGEVCITTCNSVGETINSLAGSQCSSTKGGGLMITTPSQLAQTEIADNDKNLLASLRHTLKLPLNMEVRSKFGNYGWEPDYTLNVEGVTPEKKVTAMRIIESFYQPLPVQDIIQLIARLQIIAPEKEKSGVDMKARTAIWVEELSAYPADVVKKALKSRYRWFPSLAEVLEKCSKEIAYRDLIKRGIHCCYCEE